jgi:hypothetical protein
MLLRGASSPRVYGAWPDLKRNGKETTGGTKGGEK